MSKRTIIRVLPQGEEIWVTPADIERWKKKFKENQMTPQQAYETGEVDFVTFDTPDPGEEDNYLTIVKVGDDNYRPTVADLEQWRNAFEEASKDPNFIIFAHPGVEVEVIKIGDVVAVETGNRIVKTAAGCQDSDVEYTDRRDAFICGKCLHMTQNCKGTPKPSAKELHTEKNHNPDHVDYRNGAKDENDGPPAP